MPGENPHLCHRGFSPGGIVWNGRLIKPELPWDFDAGTDIRKSGRGYRAVFLKITVVLVLAITSKY
jgi:hypothetical protein